MELWGSEISERNKVILESFITTHNSVYNNIFDAILVHITHSYICLKVLYMYIKNYEDKAKYKRVTFISLQFKSFIMNSDTAY